MFMPFVAGWHQLPGGSALDVRPRGSERVRDISGVVWTTGYQRRHVRTRNTADRDQASLSAFGPCLASETEFSAAVQGVRRGRWRDHVGSWPGSCVTVAQEPGQTIVLGDLAGASRLYLVATEAGVLWCSAATPLAAYIGSRPRLQSLVLDMAVSGLEPFAGDVPFEGVQAVPPGSALLLDRNGWRIERWYAPIQPAVYPDVEHEFRQLIVDVMARYGALGSPISGDFGGVDSSLLLWLAARDQDVVAVTYADRPESEDVRYATRVAQECRRLRHFVVQRAEKLLHYAELAAAMEPPQSDLPSLDVASLAVDREILEIAGREGSSDHLTGVGGDQVLSAPPTSLAGLLRSHSWTALAGAHELARRDRSSTTRVLAEMQRLALTSHSRSLQRVARTLGAGGTVPPELDLQYWREELAWHATLSAADCLTPATRRWASEQLLRQAARRQEYDDPATMRDWQAVRCSAANVAGGRLLGRSMGIAVHEPLLGDSVLRLLLGLAGHLRQPPGQFKPLVTNGLRDLLPPAISSRHTKGSMHKTAQEGYRHNAWALRAMVDRSTLVQAGVLDGHAVGDRIERLIQGVWVSPRPISIFLAAEEWLRGLDLDRATWWTNVEEAECIPHPGF